MNNYAISDFNGYLSKESRYLTFNEYVNKLQLEFINTWCPTFMKYILELADHYGEFCVNSSKLYKYKVIKELNVIDLFKYLNLREGKDYIISNEIELRNGVKREYKLTPDAFKRCLLQSNHCKIYAQHYNILDQFFSYYREYKNKIMTNMYYKDVDFYNKFNYCKEMCNYTC